MTRQLVLDTETTGIEVNQGHRLIEVGCIELFNRRQTGNNFWRYVNPQREIDPDAMRVHGITNEFVADKPPFAEVAQELWDYLDGAELVIHNAAFDVGFLDAEFRRAGVGEALANRCKITDTLKMARRLNPGQKANLDALCRRYGVDNSNRDFHGALLDAQLLAEVYLTMTGGQSSLTLADAGAAAGANGGVAQISFDELFASSAASLPVIGASDDELAAHLARIKTLHKKSGKNYWSFDWQPEEAPAS